MKENLYEFGLIGNNKIKTINIYTETIAAGSKRDTLTYRQAFDFLNTYLESIYMIPDNFKFDAEKPNDKIPSQWEFHYDVSIQGEAGVEPPPYSGTFLDIYVDDNDGNHFIPFASAYSPKTDINEYLKMSRIGAECYLMLSGEGRIFDIADDIVMKLTN